MEEKYTILKKYWGFESFRPVQEQIIDAVCENQDVLALLPTGGGKSICFQLPTLLTDGLCIVVTPLIALMYDQVEQLKKKGIKAIAINSSLTKREIDIGLDNCIYGDVKFLYLSPERLKTDLFRERLTKMNVSLLAIDEAHCISQWGYDFRPSYLDISEIRSLIPKVNIIALTATATSKVKVDIEEKLHLKEAKVFKRSFARTNLSYSVRLVDDKEKKLIEVLKSVPGSTIVYVNTRKATKEIATLLYRNGVSADFYHGGLPHDERTSKQQKWIGDQTRVIVATNAFGMGIDKPNVRLVIHMSLPQDLESYYQEAGRAGRDERKAYALIIHNQADIEELMQRVRIQHPSLDLMKRVYQGLANYYKLAIGSGGENSYDFDIHTFAEKFNFNNLEAYYAIKKLEEEGLLQLNESFYAPSRLFFTVDNKVLYEFQIANAVFDPLVKAILRLYGGEVFSQHLNISERQIADYLETTESKIKAALVKLNELSIVDYDSKKDQPQLLFVNQRYGVDELPIDKVRVGERKSNASGKMNEVIKYIKNSDRCRTAQLLGYFDERDFDKCGICDVCVEEKKEDYNHEMQHYREQIFAIMSEKSYVIDELIDIINPIHKEDFLEVVRQMVDTSELSYDEHWMLKMN